MARKKLFPRRHLICGLLLFGGLLILFFLLPWGIRTGINYYLAKKVTQELELDYLSLNFVTGEAKISSAQTPHFNIEHQHINWEWAPLLRKVVRISDFNLKGITLIVQHEKDGTLRMGGIHHHLIKESLLLPLLGAVEKILPLKIEVEQINIEDVKMEYTRDDFYARVNLGHLVLKPNHYSPEKILSIALTENKEHILSLTGHLSIDSCQILLPPSKDGNFNKSKLHHKLKGLEVDFSGPILIRDLVVSITSNKDDSEDDGKPVWEIQVADLQIFSQSTVGLKGEGFRSPLDVTFHPFEIQLSDFKTVSSTQPMSLAVKTKMDKKSQVSLSARGFPMIRPISLKGKTKIKQFSLPPFSALAERIVGYQVESGCLNLDTSFDIKKGMLTSENTVLLEKIRMGSVEEGELDPLSDHIGIPVETGIALLKDKNGNIHLNVPLQADLRDKHLQLGSAIGKVVAQGIQQSILKTVGVVFSPFKMATQIRFDPIEFEPKTARLVSTSESYLKELGNLMNEKPGLDLRVCGVGTPADLGKRQGKGNDVPKSELQDLSETDKNTVLSLAQERSEKVKTFLGTNFNLPSNRFFSCSPEWDGDPKSPPRVELHF